ncbi:MAG: hypothetical protein CL610_18460 [Anaerolineaceae bacterium]|nr:hypothetical protein [Anaerolineaceae bacterium]
MDSLTVGLFWADYEVRDIHIPLKNSEVKASDLIIQIVSRLSESREKLELYDDVIMRIFDNHLGKFLENNDLIISDDKSRYYACRFKKYKVELLDGKVYEVDFDVDQSICNIISEFLGDLHHEPINSYGNAYYPLLYSIRTEKILNEYSTLVEQGVMSNETLKVIERTFDDGGNSLKFRVQMLLETYSTEISLNINIPSKYLLPLIVQALKEPLLSFDHLTVIGDNRSHFAITQTNEMKPLDSDKTLKDAGIKEGDVISLFPVGVGGGGFDPTSISISNKPSSEVHFKVFAPKEINIRQRSQLIVYSFSLADSEAIEMNFYKFRDEFEYAVQSKSSSKAVSVLADSQILVVPESEELEFEPPLINKRWDEDWLRCIFDFIPSPAVDHETAFIRISFQIESIEIACIKIAIDLLSNNTLGRSNNPLADASFQRQSSAIYQKIFVSYSHSDASIARRYKNAQIALGNEVFIDVDNLRSGENWKSGLAKAIDVSDVFQLFWSNNSASSIFCQYEWQYALEFKCPETLCEGFIRPVFWAYPMPTPPKPLQHLHFRFSPLN